MVTVVLFLWSLGSMVSSTPAAGVPRTLAEARASRLSGLRYDLRFEIPASKTQPIHGREAIRFVFSAAGSALALDFAQPDRLRSIVVNGRSVAIDAPNGHPILPAEALQPGENVVAIDFIAGEASLNRSGEFLYTLFVPARASLAFPCFDQPDLKARWTLGLEVPAGWEAIANGAEIERAPVGSGFSRTLQFAETEPLPTYLFAFAAGRLQIETAERAGRRFRMLHRETDPARVARNRDAIFDLHASALAWLQRVWSKEEGVPGLTFSETDDIELSLELAVRAVPAWKDILNGQLDRTKNPDRKARFAFIMPALSSDQTSRDRFFESLKDLENRRREPWVLEAVGYLHLRCAPRDRSSTSSPACACSARSSGPATFSFRAAGWTRRSADTRPAASRTSSARLSTACRATIRCGYGTSSLRRRTSSSGPTRR